MEGVDKTDAIIGRNLAYLISAQDLSYRAAGKLTKVNDRMLKFVVDGSSSPTVDIVIKIAKAFKIAPWLMLHPDLPALYPTRKALALLIENYAKCGDESRSYIERAAEHETRYGRINAIIGDITGKRNNNNEGGNS